MRRHDNDLIRADAGGARWLREVVSEEIAGLFGDGREEIASTISRLLERIAYDETLEANLIEVLEASLDDGNDDTQGSVWLTLLLGEAAITRALPTLLRALSTDDDEELQTAAGIAILKCGAPGIDALIDGLEDASPTPSFIRAAYTLLGRVGYLEDVELTRRVALFLNDVLAGLVVTPEAVPTVEGAAHAAAWIGHVGALPALKEARRRPFLERSVELAEAISMLEENVDGVPVCGDVLPGEEEYRWAFEYSGEMFRPQRRDGRLELVARVSGAAHEGLRNEEVENEDQAEELRDLETFYRGLGSVPEEE